MKTLLLAGAIVVATGTTCLAEGFFWVVGNRTTGRCPIVTSNPLIDGTVIWFGDGPYKSMADAKLARSTINACPKEDDPSDSQTENSEPR